VSNGIGEILCRSEETSANAPVVIGYGLWQRRFGGNASAVDQKIVVNQQVHSIAGVLPRDFHFFDMDTEVWIPIGFPDIQNQDSNLKATELPLSRCRRPPQRVPTAFCTQYTALHTALRYRLAVRQGQPEPQERLASLLQPSPYIIALKQGENKQS
jgi:hypothetical protein